MSEEMLFDLVGDDDLNADEETVIGAVAKWIQGGGGEEGRGERVLREIRYGLMETLRLREVVLKAEEMLAGGATVGACE